MGEFTYEEQGTYTWLVYRIEDDREIDSLSLGMLTKNKVPGILPVVYTPINNTGYFKYNVSSQVSVKDYLTGMVNRERILGLFSGIVNAMTSAESYMLDVNSLVLDLEHIFVNVSTRETHMVCVPVLIEEQRHMDLAGFFRSILFTVQFDPSESFDYVTMIVNYLNSTQMFSLEEFGKLVARLDHEEKAADTWKHSGPAVVASAPVRTHVPLENKGNHPVDPPLTPGESQEEAGGIMIPGSPGRVGLPGKPGEGKPKKQGLLGSLMSRKKQGEREKKKGKIPAPHPEIPLTVDDIGPEVPYGATVDDFDLPGAAALRLIYITEGRTIAVSSFPFEIGREGNGLKIDAAKTKISRRHAVITQSGERFLITDFSKHGTFLNGVRIPQGEPRILENGMHILLKTEEFEVKIDNA